jgi:hypothetical protein
MLIPDFIVLDCHIQSRTISYMVHPEAQNLQKAQDEIDAVVERKRVRKF